MILPKDENLKKFSNSIQNLISYELFLRTCFFGAFSQMYALENVRARSVDFCVLSS